jgi:hypothetical protein
LSGPVHEGVRSSRQMAVAPSSSPSRAANTDLPDPAGPSTAMTRVAPALAGRARMTAARLANVATRT